MDEVIKLLFQAVASQAGIATIVSTSMSAVLLWMMVKQNQRHDSSVKEKDEAHSKQLKEMHESCREERREMVAAMTLGMNHQATATELLVTAVSNLRVAVASKTGVEA